NLRLLLPTTGRIVRGLGQRLEPASRRRQHLCRGRCSAQSPARRGPRRVVNGLLRSSVLGSKMRSVEDRTSSPPCRQSATSAQRWSPSVRYAIELPPGGTHATNSCPRQWTRRV